MRWEKADSPLLSLTFLCVRCILLLSFGPFARYTVYFMTALAGHFVYAALLLLFAVRVSPNRLPTVVGLKATFTLATL
jgi:hypothetical protein